MKDYLRTLRITKTNFVALIAFSSSSRAGSISGEWNAPDGETSGISAARFRGDGPAQHPALDDLDPVEIRADRVLEGGHEERASRQSR